VGGYDGEEGVAVVFEVDEEDDGFRGGLGVEAVFRAWWQCGWYFFSDSVLVVEELD